MTCDGNDSENVPSVRSVHNLFTILFNLQRLKSNQLFISALMSPHLFHYFLHKYHFLLHAFFWVRPWHLNFVCQHFGTLWINLHRRVDTNPPTKSEQTECSETSAYKIQTPGNYPEADIQHSEHGRSLKSRIFFTYVIHAQLLRNAIMAQNNGHLNCIY
jgi:hypothetical protein